MRTIRWPIAILALGLLISSASWFLAGAQAFTRFLPPRTAVVDISQIFEKYQKRIDRAEDLKTTFDSVMQELEQLKETQEVLQRDVQDLKPGSEAFRLKYLEHLEVSEKIKQLQATKGQEFEEKRTAYVEEIRQEIKVEIQVVAEAEELDLVLERAVTAESSRAGLGFHWAIVHFAKPEFEITEKVTKRLNERYKRP